MLLWKLRSTLPLATLVFLFGADLPADELDLSRFEKHVVVEDLVQPMELDIAPGGNIFLIELAGLLKFIDAGDNTNPFADSQGYAPLDQRIDRSPWDAQRTAGNTKNYNGKILRIHPEPDGTYSIPEGNLFPKDGPKGHPEIYVM